MPEGSCDPSGCIQGGLPMECTIRRLTAQDLPAAMELAMDTFLRFEAPKGPDTLKAPQLEHTVCVERESMHAIFGQTYATRIHETAAVNKLVSLHVRMA